MKRVAGHSRVCLFECELSLAHKHVPAVSLWMTWMKVFVAAVVWWWCVCMGGGVTACTDARVGRARGI